MVKEQNQLIFLQYMPYLLSHTFFERSKRGKGTHTCSAMQYVFLPPLDLIMQGFLSRSRITRSTVHSLFLAAGALGPEFIAVLLLMLKVVFYFTLRVREKHQK